MSDVEFVMVVVVVEFVVEQEVDSVLVEVVEEDELVAVELVLLVVDVDDVLVVVELLAVVFELVVEDVVKVVLLVADESVVDADDVLAVDEEVVGVDDDLEEELEELELGGVRTTYAPTPATAITTIIMAVIITGAIALLLLWRSVSIGGLKQQQFC